jgi:hypothetical protein
MSQRQERELEEEWPQAKRTIASGSKFEKGDLKAALEGFEFLGSRDSNDAVVRLHAHRCRSFLEQGIQGHWDPALAYPTGESKP